MRRMQPNFYYTLSIIVAVWMVVGCNGPDYHIFTPIVKPPAECTQESRASIVLHDSTYFAYSGLGCRDSAPWRTGYSQRGESNGVKFLHTFYLSWASRDRLNKVELNLTWSGPVRELPIYIDPIYIDSLAQIDSAIQFNIYPTLWGGSANGLYPALYDDQTMSWEYIDQNAVISSSYKLSTDSLGFGDRYRLSVDYHYTGYLYIFSYIQHNRILDSVKVDLHFENLIVEGA